MLIRTITFISLMVSIGLTLFREPNLSNSIIIVSLTLLYGFLEFQAKNFSNSKFNNELKKLEDEIKTVSERVSKINMSSTTLFKK